jgi:hypothetical protein
MVGQKQDSKVREHSKSLKETYLPSLHFCFSLWFFFLCFFFLLLEKKKMVGESIWNRRLETIAKSERAEWELKGKLFPFFWFCFFCFFLVYFVFFVLEKKKTMTMCYHHLLCYCWNKKNNNNKFSSPFFLCLRKKKKNGVATRHRLLLWWCFNEDGNGSFLPSLSSLMGFGCL